MEKERRFVSIDDVELRVAEKEDGGRMISGYAARFNAWSEDLGGFRERLRPGAFAKALMGSDVRALYNHDSNNLPLGRVPRTLRLMEDTRGLRFECDLPDTQFAKDLAESIKRKDITGCSFSFRVGENGDEWREKDGVTSRTISEVQEMFDVGPVVFPAYQSTSVSARSVEKAKECSTGVTAGDDDTGVTARKAKDERMSLEADLLIMQGDI
jgi:hypothetical protein